MNRRYYQKNRMPFKSSNFSRNNYSSFKPVTRRPRLNKRFNPIARRNRLQRVQNVINSDKNFRRPYQQRSFNNNNNANNNGNNNNYVNNNREIYVKGLPRYMDHQGLFNLFKTEGRIINSNIVYDNVGFSRGVGRILFANFRDALNVVKKWNNVEFKGNTLKVEYKTPKINAENRNNNTYNKFGNVNNKNNNYIRPFKFNQANHYSNKFRYNNYNRNYNNSGRYHAFNKNYYY